MRRRALIVSMALITGMPGLAKAKGEAKSAGNATTGVAHSAVATDIDRLQDRAEGNSRKAAEVLAQIKQLLKQDKGEGRIPEKTPASNIATLQLGLIGQDSGITANGHHRADARYMGDDPRIQSSKPWGVAFHMKF